MDSSAIFAKSEKDIPEWAKRYHEWEASTEVSKLKKLEVKMRICCNSCEEKIGDEIRGMPGVFDFKTDKTNDLLTICESPGEGPNHKQLLKKLKKVDKRAQIVTKPDNNNTNEPTEGNVVYVAVPVMAPGMTPWNPQLGMSMWPPFLNYNYLQHRVSCGQCLGYSDAVCGNCGRGSELGAVSQKDSETD